MIRDPATDDKRDEKPNKIGMINPDEYQDDILN
jgi:hypothetical protein